jgi:CRISPR-associated protein Csm3
LIITLFGESAGSGDRENTKITRVIFRDTFLSKESRKLYLEDKISLSEEKAENTINRVTVTANPRFMERVPAGVEFDFEVILREFDEDKDLPLAKTIELGLKLLENDALGGGGSRGNGKIEFGIYQKEDRNLSQEIKELMEEIEVSL